ncbi:hypothetical protein ACHAW6_004986 [Cyclotella cf. meneghiniana]
MDCKGQTSSALSLGKGAAASCSRKQKVDTQRSTEMELMGVCNATPSILRSLYFLQEQWYDTSHALIYQDNKSAILLEINGKQSSSKMTKQRRKHICM